MLLRKHKIEGINQNLAICRIAEVTQRLVLLVHLADNLLCMTDITIKTVIMAIKKTTKAHIKASLIILINPVLADKKLH